MFAETSHVQLLEPNVLYLDEKPPKIIKMARTKKRRERKTKSKVVAKRGRVEKSKLKNKSTAAKRTQSCDTNYDDPLYTSGEKEIKMEIEKSFGKEEEKSFGIENEVKLEEDLERVATIPEDDEGEFVLKSEPENDEEYECHNLEEEEEEEEEGDSDNEADSREEYEDDEPLIKLTRRKGRPRKYALQFTDNGDKRPGLALCRDICKQKCSQKFSEDVRQQMCRSFWSLSEDQKVEFIRRHTKTKRYVRLKRNRSKMRGNNFCYYLDECSNREEDKDDDEGGGGVEETNITRVCRKYFELTLCLTNYTIKKALEGYTPQVEEKTTTSAATQEEDREQRETQNNSKEPEQYLDAETGNLITIDPKAGKQGKAHKEKSNCDDPETLKKKQRVRLKPGEKRLHSPKPIKCAERCIHKCHTKFSEEDRQQICNVFWSLDYNRRKDFILARIETREVETERAPEFRKSNRPPRAYHTRFFLRSPKSNENIRVCKHFMMATLSIARTFITNAIDYADKNTGCYTGCDRRGLNSTPKRVSPDRMQLIKDHIGSYPTWIPHKKSKTRYLHHTLSIKRMYEEYRQLCEAQQRKFVSTNMYYKTFHEEFRLSFLSNPVPKRGGGFLKANPNVSHYTGEESGGMWLDPQGDKLDVGLHNPAQSFMIVPRSSRVCGEISTTIDLAVSSSTTTTATTKSENVPTATTSLFPALHPSTQTSFGFNQTFINYGHWTEPMLNPSNLVGQSAAVQQEFHSNLYENHQPQPAHTSSLGSLFRKL